MRLWSQETAARSTVQRLSQSCSSMPSPSPNHLSGESSRPICGAFDPSSSPPRPSNPDGPDNEAIFSNGQRQLTDVKAVELASKIFGCLLFATPCGHRLDLC